MAYRVEYHHDAMSEWIKDNIVSRLINFILNGLAYLATYTQRLILIDFMIFNLVISCKIKTR